MKTLKFEDEKEWRETRRIKITGTRLKDILIKKGKKKKIGFYQLIADRIGIPPDDENPMERGKRLEPEAIKIFEKETKKNVDSSLMMWVREDNENIAISPDGVISKTEAIEVKCLGSAHHIEALITGNIPSEYEDQVIQYFIVSDELKTLYLTFYDPRIKYKTFFYLTITREQLEEKIEAYREQQETTLKEVEEIVNKLSGF